MKHNRTCEVRGFYLNIIKGFLMLSCLIVIILFSTGLVQVQAGLNEIFDIDKNGTDRIPLPFKGLINILITFTLFFCMDLFLKHTLRKKNWWQKLMKTFDLDSESSKIMTELKGKSSDIYLLFNGSMAFMGLLMIVIGFIFLNTVDIIITNIVSCMVIFLGIFPIFWGFKRYQSDVENFSQFIVPSLFKRVGEID